MLNEMVEPEGTFSNRHQGDIFAELEKWEAILRKLPGFSSG
jgi:hypothetical protein